MSSAVALVKEVEATLRDAPIEKRTEILRRVTDLFLVSAPTADEPQVAVFDGVMAQLVTYVEQKAVAELSRRIAAFANAPPMTARQMARHDNLEISGPILAKSPVLTDHDLIEIAASKKSGAPCANRAAPAADREGHRRAGRFRRQHCRQPSGRQCRRALLQARHGQAGHARRGRRTAHRLDCRAQRHSAAHLPAAAGAGDRSRAQQTARTGQA